MSYSFWRPQPWPPRALAPLCPPSCNEYSQNTDHCRLEDETTREMTYCPPWCT